MKICPLPKSFPTQVAKSIFQTIQNAWTFCTNSFLTSRSIFGHIWPSGGLMQTIGENIDKTAFTFSASQKKGFNISEIFFENEFLKDMEIYQKKTN